MNEPFLRNIPDELDDDATPEEVIEFKKMKAELAKVQARRQFIFEEHNIVFPIQEVGHAYRAQLLVDFILGIDTEARFKFERHWIDFMATSMERGLNEHLQRQKAQKNAKHLHLADGQVHQVLPPEEPNAKN